MHRFFLCFLITLLSTSLTWASPEASLKPLRVGTPGDYAPYSLFDKDTQHYKGLDITLIEQFADTYHYKITYVPTTWSTLLADLNADRFDIAIGGISKTKQRANVARLSKTYNKGGKVFIVSCNTHKPLKTLSDINNAEITVAENIGGTNEMFARKHCQRARLLLFKENAAVFETLRQGKADLMITDLEEALWAHQQYPSLCIVHDKAPLTTDEKVFLLQRHHTTLHAQFNAWLSGRQRSGQLKRLKKQWLPEASS